MAGAQGDVYANFGLRRDDQGDEAKPSTSVPRPSWFAFQRLAELLGDVVLGRMLIPEVADRVEMAALFGSPSTSMDRAVVFEYELGAPNLFRYAYLVFIDVDVEGVVVSFLAHRWRSRVGRAKCQTILPFMETVSVPGPGRLPVGHASYYPANHFPVGGQVMVQEGDMALLITATERIQWISLPRSIPNENAGSGGVRGALGDLQTRPAWLDDPCAPLPGPTR
jgi:hypothetical protein